MSGEPDGLLLSHDIEHRTPDRTRSTASAPAPPSGPDGHPARNTRTESLYGMALADDPGAIASTRRLAFAVLGVPEALDPAVLRDALEDRAQAARAAGCLDSAAAFESAEHYVARAVAPSAMPPSGDVRPSQPSRTVLFAAAVRQARRAYALLPDDRAGQLGLPLAAPDPAFVERPAALIDDLRGLTESSGLSCAAIAAAARRHGLRVTDDQLAATLDRRRFPTPTVTEAIARGCGLDEQQSCAWLAARHRAARAFLIVPRAEAEPLDPRLAAVAALDPQTAQSPAQLAVLLAELRARRGLSYGQLQLAAKRAGYDVSWSRLWAVGAHYAFPTPRVLEAFLAGCGIAAPEQTPWLEARERLATKRARVRRTAQPAAAEVSRSQEPRQCNPPPNPQEARTWAQFCALLRVLVHWSGHDLSAIAQRALGDGIPVTREALHYTLAYSTLPGVNTLNAFTAGCGLSSLEQLHWRIVRARLATLPPDSQRLPSVLGTQAGGGRQQVDGH